MRGLIRTGDAVRAGVRSALLPVMVVSMLWGCDATDETSGGADFSEGIPCSRGSATRFEAGSVNRIGDVGTPCQLRFRETGVVLSGDAEVVRPHPGNQIVRLSNGQYLSTNAAGFQSQISHWDSDGRYLGSFGRPGEGPGELSARGGIAGFILDRQDRLHVTDGSLRWSLFDSNQAFVRAVPSLAIGDIRAVLEDGSVLSRRLEGQYTFRVADSTGIVRRLLIPNDSSAMAAIPGGTLVGAPTAYAGGETFWLGPATDTRGYSPYGYRLEEWHIEGRLLRTIQRDVPWFPNVWPPPPRGDRSMTERPPVRISRLHLDPDGLLLVTIVGPSSSWRSEPVAVPVEERRPMTEFRVEVIDTRSGAVLVSQVYESLPFSGFFPGTNLGYKLHSGVDLLPRAVMLEYDLIGR